MAQPLHLRGTLEQPQAILPKRNRLSAWERVSGWPPDGRQLLAGFLWLVTCVLLATHYVHLKADFPNHSPWMDWAKYTDEGWYGDAALRYFQRGSWYVPGDFNPAAALPVWPMIEGVIFAFTGVSLVAARAASVTIFLLAVFSSALLLRKWSGVSHSKTALAPPVAALLLAASPFCYVFTRMAILEPLLILLMPLALLAATTARGGRRWTPAFSLGVLLPMLVLTKTTAVFLFPSIGWMLWASCGRDLRRFSRLAAPAVSLAVMLWCGWYGLVVHPRYVEDYQYLFSANAYTVTTLQALPKVFWKMVADGLWMGPLLYTLTMVTAVVSLPRLFSRRRNPLIGALVLWVAGYMVFLTYHNNLQPRYYLVVAVPMTLLLPLMLEEWWQKLRGRNLRAAEALFLTAAAVLSVIVWRDARLMLHYEHRPEYSLLTAAREVATVVRQGQKIDPAHSNLVLSISGSNISLMTGLPSICDDYGTLELQDRVAKYKPGWYVAWNQIDDDKMDALTPYYHVERVATFAAMDDPERNQLVVYRLDAKAQTPFVRHRGKPIPPSLRTKMGQQPSTQQLEH